MLSAASAIAYAQATERQWRIDWSDGVYAPNQINAIPLLFQNMSQHAFSITADQTNKVTPVVWEGRLTSPVRKVISEDYPKKHSSPFIYRLLSAPFTQQAQGDGIEMFWSYTSKYGRIKRFLTYEQQILGRDCVLSSVLKKYFIPHANISLRSDTLLKNQDGNVLGVHIRYTDLKVPIEKLMHLSLIHI